MGWSPFNRFELSLSTRPSLRLVPIIRNRDDLQRQAQFGQDREQRFQSGIALETEGLG